MLKKEEVYVRVSSEKKARKLKELLEMFGEPKDILTFEGFNVLETPWFINNECSPCVVFYENEWIGSCSEFEIGLIRVSLKELRNILAKDKLKEGDIVVCKCSGYGNEYIVKFDKFVGNNIEGRYLHDFHNGIRLTKETGHFDNFIRYATEEEKALLETKKELEVGKWYKHPNGSVYFINHECDRGHLYGYGFDEKGNWDVKHQSDSRYCAFNSVAKYDITEATQQEVEEALIKEAKRIGFVNGALCNNSNVHDVDLKNNRLSFENNFEFDLEYNTLRAILDSETTYSVFKNGKWAEVIKPEKSLEERVKELENVVFGDSGVQFNVKFDDVQKFLDNLNKR